ncbi:Unknown protein, partial [Striga hermonthica]
WTTARPLGHDPPPGFSGPSQTPITPKPILQGVGVTTAIPGVDAGSSRTQEARAAAAAAMPPPQPPNPTMVQGGAMAQGGAPPPATTQTVGQQMVAMTREEMQKIAAAAVAQAVQQVASHTSHVTTAPTTVVGSQDEDVSSYGEGGVGRDRAMERMAEQLRLLQDKVEGRPERRARGHPFSREILAAPLPNNFKETNLVYDGSSYPSRHVRTFENMAVLHGYSDSVCCKAFLSTLRGGALDWFHQLPPGSIADFEDFAGKLTNQYSSAVAQEKTYLTLMAMRQGEKDSLRKYVARYNQTCLEVHSASDEMKAGGLIRSLRAGPCRTSLANTPARSYEDVLKRCRKCREDSEERSDRDEEGDGRDGRDGRGKKPRRDGDKERHGGEASVKRGMIYIIFGRATDGDSNRARKEHARAVKRKREEVGITARMPVIKFKVEDAEGVVLPHNDALVITAEIAGFDVKRVFIDTESSVDVMLYDCFVQINKELNMELKPVTKALYGFNGGEVMPMGEVSLPVAMGSGELRKVRMVRFVVENQMIEGCEGRKFRIGKDLEEPIRLRLIQLVREFADIFAYTAEELTGISAEVIEHRLNIDLSMRPVKQKRRHHGAEMDKIIEQEVEKLLGARHIKEIQFPEWLSNTVMVSKAEGKWRMCIDFRDLNKACPKDLYPLPRIDQLVDSTAGCELLSLMDASQGYHQISLAREDRKRVSFVTSRGTYCYVVMPFGLNNAGATYQRLVDKIFKEQLGRNMEVYVDDMLVKSKEESDYVRDLKETFLTLRRYGMKLYPAKCSFGVRSGKFLGYLVTKR